MLYRKCSGVFVSIFMFFAVLAQAAEPLRVAIFHDGNRMRAADEIKKTLEDNGIVAEIFNTKGADYSEFHDYDVIFFGAGHSRYRWLTLDAKMQLVEHVEKRGGGAIFSIFRCGTVARSMIRPPFPDVADAYNKVNSRGITVIEPDHPLMEGIPETFLLPYWDHAVMRLGPQGRAIAVNSGNETAIACGESGLGRVVFLGPWIGLNTQGRPVYPMEGHDEQLLVNSVRWAGGAKHRDKSEFEELTEETQFKVLRRERTFDWIHDERGKSWTPGLLTQARDRREQELDDLSFRLSRYTPIAEQSGESGQIIELQEELSRLKDELYANHKQAVIQKKLEISRMTMEELKEDPFPHRSDKREIALEEWRNRLVFPHQMNSVSSRVHKLQAQLEPELQKFHQKRFAAARAEDERNVRNLIDQLESENPETRAAAALEIGRINESGRRIEKALTALLNDTDYTVRRNAIYALSWIQSQRAVPELIKVLETSDDTRTRRRAAQALGQIGDPRAVDALLQIIEDSDAHLRHNAILALGWIGDSKATTPLLHIIEREAHEDGDHRTLYCAIRAVGHIGDTAAIPVLESDEMNLPSLRGAEIDIASEAIESIKAGGRGMHGIQQLDEMRDPIHFYWMSGRYNALFGRYVGWQGEPIDSNVMLGYAADSGGTGTINFRTIDRWEKTHPHIPVDEHFEYATRLGLKVNTELPTHPTLAVKALYDRELMRLAHHPSFGGFWGEECLDFDHAYRSLGDITVKEFREFLKNRYTQEKLTELGIKDVETVELPGPDNKDRLPAYLRSETRAKQKVLFAEYMEYLSERGVPEWAEMQEFVAGFRKGGKISFSLSDRYYHGGSTYIKGYPGVNLAIDAAGPQSYGEHSSLNNFNLDLHVDGESRPAQGEFYAHQADTPGRVERGFASSFVYGQQFFNWWWGHIFKHTTSVNAGGLQCDPGRWAAAVRQFRKGSALSAYLAPRETTGADLVTQLYSGRSTTLTYGDGTTDGFGGRQGETVSPSGYPFRYTQNQVAFRESIVRSHLPVEMTWLETQTPEKLARWKVVILADGVSISDSEVEMLREWVHNGGTLIATASSTLHDRWDRKQENYSLADVFGVNYVRTEGTPGLEYVERDIKPESGIHEIRITAPEYLGLMEGAVSTEYEKAIGYDVIEPVTATVVGVWEDDTPAIVENRFGDGHAIFIAASYPALSHWTRDWTVHNLYNIYWPGMRELLAACVRRGLDLTGTDLPLAVENCPETVDVVLKRQERNNRWMAHLLNMDEKNGLIQDVRMKVKPPSPVKAVYYAYPERTEIEFESTDNGIEFIVRPFDVHEIVVVEF